MGAKATPPYQSMYISIANPQSGGATCTWGEIHSGPYAGGVDELRIFHRHINATEVWQLSLAMSLNNYNLQIWKQTNSN